MDTIPGPRHSGRFRIVSFALSGVGPRTAVSQELEEVSLLPCVDTPLHPGKHFQWSAPVLTDLLFQASRLRSAKPMEGGG